MTDPWEVLEQLTIECGSAQDQATLATLREQVERQETALRETHGVAQAMAEMDSWIAEQCGMVDDGESYYVPAARAALSTEEPGHGGRR